MAENDLEDGLVWKPAPVAPPAEGAVVGFELAGLRMLVCRGEGELYVLNDRCPHALVRLSEGTLRGCILECPVHGGKIDVRDGFPVAGPIQRPAITHPVRERENTIEVGLPAPHSPSRGFRTR